MKPLHKYITSTFLLVGMLSATMVFAQTENKYKSRLDVKPKTKTTFVAPFKPSHFSFYKPLNNTLDRNFNTQRAAAINQYFAASLLQQRTSKVSSTKVESVTSNTESTRSEEVINSEERLFSSDKLMVSNIYPNPADDFAQVKYDISSQGNFSEVKISFYNVLGGMVHDELLDKDQNKTSISTKDWPNGVYLYQLSANGKSLVTKKLLVRHQ